MKLRKSVKLSLFLVLLIAFMGIGFLNYDKVKNFVVTNLINKNVLFDGLDDYDTFSSTSGDTLGTWHFSTTYESDNTLNKYKDDSQVFYVKDDSDSLLDNSITVTYNITYDGDYTENDFENYGAYVYVPVMLYDGDEGYTTTYNEDGTFSIYNGDVEVARTSLGDMKSDSDATSSDDIVFDYYGAVDGYIYVYNNNTISKDSSYMFSFDVTYYFVPSSVSNEVSVIEPYLSIYDYSTDATLDMSLNLLFSLEDAEEIVDTTLGTFEKYVNLYEEWQSDWGTNSLGDGYYYYAYTISGTATFPSAGTITLEYTYDEGTLVSYYNGSYYSKYDYGFYDISASEAGDVNVTRTVIVAYPLPDEGETDSVSFKATLSRNTLTEDFEWSMNYYRPKEEVEEPEYPTGTNISVSESSVLSSAGVGAINVLNSGSDVSFTWLMEPKSATMNQTASGVVRAFNLFNRLDDENLEYSITMESTGVSLDSSSSESDSSYDLDSSMYQIVSFYPQDDIEYDYELVSNSYVLSEVTDVSSYGDKDVYVYIDGTWSLIGSYKKDSNGNINYVNENDQTSAVDNVSSSNPVILPSGVTDIKVVYEGSRAAIYMGINVTGKLIASDTLVNTISNFISSSDQVVLRSSVKAIDEVGNEESTSYSSVYLTEFKTSSSLSSTVSTNERGTDSDNIVYKVTLYEQINYSSSNKDLALDYLNIQNKGVFYDLLPEGATLDSLSVLEYNTSNEVDYTYSVTDNYNSSGRSLVTITINDDDLTIDENDTYARNGFVVTLDIDYSFDSNQIYGTELLNDIVYESSNISDGYDSIEDISSSSFSSSETIDILSTLSTEGKLVACYNSTSVDSISVSVGTYNKSVKYLDGDYADSASVKEGTSYSYRLQYVPVSNYDKIENLIFLDELDSSTTSESSFKGILDYVDTSYLNNKGVSTTVYYSTSDVIDLSNDNDLDFTDSSLWQSTMPTDKSKITAVAIDCGSYVFSASDGISPMVDIVLTAPNEYVVKQSRKAYNNSYLKYNTVSKATSTLVSNTTTVELLQADISVKQYYATSSSDTSELTGSEDDPIVVSSSYGYKILISNDSDSTSYDNLVVTDILPDGVSVNGDITTSEGATITNTDGVITITISKLEESSSISVWIPVSMDDDTNDVYINKAYLSYLNSSTYDGEVSYVYTKAMVPTLSFAKYAKTNDSKTYKNDEVLIVKKGETFSYKISISNTSSIDASSVVITDNIASGLTNVSNISNNGSYDEDTGVITWNIDIGASSSVDLTYEVTVPDDISLGTIYSSSAHIKMINPLNNSVYLYDEDMNNLSLLYQVVSDIEVTNKISGNLASSTKEFTYTVELDGSSSAMGDYTIYKNGSSYSTISLDSEGKGSVTLGLKGNDVITIKHLPGNVNYVISLSKEEGYEVSSSTTLDSDDGSYKVSGVTSVDGSISYEFVNSYDVKTSSSVSINVTYDKELQDKMFKFVMKDSDGNELTSMNDVNGNVTFDEITFDNVEGLFTYTIVQEDTNLQQVYYDTSTYYVTINVVNDGKGNLSSTVLYYSQDNNAIDGITFENKYLPTGITLSNVNNSNYVDSSIEFNYKFTFTSAMEGEYSITDSNGKEIDKLVISSDGSGSYETTLKSYETILISDLPIGTEYSISQDSVPYYDTVVDTISLRGSEDEIVYSGILQDESIQVNFYNTYTTEAKFAPSFKVVLEDKELEEGEFVFQIKDVSEGVSNGYKEYMSNDEVGDINFTEITYDRPGVYKYEITQVIGNSNHIYYDESKAILNVTLTDNGDGTMSYEYNITYENEKDSFVNRYSEEPIVVENKENSNTSNPNTFDNILIVGISLLSVILIFLVYKAIKIRRY